jgi:hypothetical protein
VEQLDLYSVSTTGRVTLGDLVEGVQFLTAEKDDTTGVVTLTPVRINPAHRATAPQADLPAEADDNPPFAA